MLVSTFLAYILPDVPGCPNYTAQVALLRAAQELCRSALVWDEVQDPITLKDGVNEYPLDAPSGAMVCSVKQVFVGVNQLTPKTQAELTRIMPDWQTAQATLPAYYNGARGWDTVWVYPIPLGATTPMTVHACYEPRLDATSLPDFLVNECHDALVYGAKSRLMRMRNQQWSDPQQAAQYAQDFDTEVAKARIQMDHAKFPSDMTVAPRRFGR